MSSEELRDHRHGEARGSGALPTLLGCLPGLLAVLAPALCTEGVERSVTVRLRNARHPAPAHGRPPRRPAPPVGPRSAWLDRATRRTQPPPRYDDRVVAVFLHHTDSPPPHHADRAAGVQVHLPADTTRRRPAA